jgi:CHAD domain-containing protein
MAKAKRIKGMKCNAPATTGMKLVLVTRFEELHAWRDAALDWTDPEGVHSMRVASRRLRSALRDFTPYLRKRNVNSALKELKSVADALGRVRDLDVAILALEEIGKHAPPKFSNGVKQFVDARSEVRERARKDLKATLRKGQLRRLETEFHGGVEKAVVARERKNQRIKVRPQSHTDGTDGQSQVVEVPVVQGQLRVVGGSSHGVDGQRDGVEGQFGLTFVGMSREVILDRLREFERLSKGLFKPLDADALHELRIAVKRLRYALELFQQCWPRALSTSAKRAARIQTALGDLHDCDVWIETLGKHITAARKQKDEEYVAALVWLLGHLIKLRTKHLRRALARWREWETHDTSGRLRATLETKHRTPRRRRRTTRSVAVERRSSGEERRSSGDEERRSIAAESVATPAPLDETIATNETTSSNAEGVR